MNYKDNMNYPDRIKSLLKLLPHKLQVSYALACAESVFEYVRDEDKEVIRKNLDTVKLWLEDKVTANEIVVIYGTAYSATSYATHAAHAAYSTITANTAAYAAHAAYSAANAAYSAYSAYSAASYATHAAKSAIYSVSSVAISTAKDSKYYYNLLLKMVKENMSTLDKILLGLE